MRPISLQQAGVWARAGAGKVWGMKGVKGLELPKFNSELQFEPECNGPNTWFGLGFDQMAELNAWFGSTFDKLRHLCQEHPKNDELNLNAMNQTLGSVQHSGNWPNCSLSLVLRSVGIA